MRAGEFPNGARVLRAKIDMASGNMNLRDPVLYRILHAHHPRTGDAWCIYPTYDFAHGQSDAIEHITHCVCTLEFEDHRPLYDWLIEHLPVPVPPAPVRVRPPECHLHRPVEAPPDAAGRPRSTSAGWDDPRMPTLAGIRRRGVPAAALREFVAASAWRAPTASSMSRCSTRAIRDTLNPTAPRRMAVLRPLKLIIENYPEGATETLEAPQPSGQSRCRHAGSRSAANSTSSATTSWRTRRRSSTACPR